jgi:hypothetical protein
VPPRLRKIRCDRSVGAPPPPERDTDQAISQENVELLYRAYDAFNGRDLDAFLALIDPEVELTTRIMELEGGSNYRGHDGVREWWRALFAVFPDFGYPRSWKFATSASR